MDLKMFISLNTFNIIISGAKIRVLFQLHIQFYSHILPGSIGDTACDVSTAMCRGLEQTHLRIHCRIPTSHFPHFHLEIRSQKLEVNNSIPAFTYSPINTSPFVKLPGPLFFVFNSMYCSPFRAGSRQCTHIAHHRCCPPPLDCPRRYILDGCP